MLWVVRISLWPTILLIFYRGTSCFIKEVLNECLKDCGVNFFPMQHPSLTNSTNYSYRLILRGKSFSFLIYFIILLDSFLSKQNYLTPASLFVVSLVTYPFPSLKLTFFVVKPHNSPIRRPVE